MEVFSFDKRLSISAAIRRLLAGEGDFFFFSVCLARSFGLADNKVATSLDSKEFLDIDLFKNYEQ
ncbi:hypothetical protein ACE6H2_026272 [Prunus campanulata]